MVGLRISCYRNRCLLYQNVLVSPSHDMYEGSIVLAIAARYRGGIFVQNDSEETRHFPRNSDPAHIDAVYQVVLLRVS